MSDIDTGLWAWRHPGNNRKLLALQDETADWGAPGQIRIEYFGASAFRITSPKGLRLFIDPWRNLPSGSDGQWFLRDMSIVEAEIGLSTHAHFDHDALHRVNAEMLLDRIVGRFTFADVLVEGIADKHVSDFSGALFDTAEYATSRGINIYPPDNVRNFDNVIFIVNTAGLRIMHWGDNRSDPPEHVWQKIGKVDIALLPVDGSKHVLTYEQVDYVLRRTSAKICIPHHYFIKGLSRIGSTLLPTVDWLKAQSRHVRKMEAATLEIATEEVRNCEPSVCYFGDHIIT